jgi:hypothetical protein
MAARKKRSNLQDSFQSWHRGRHSNQTRNLRMEQLEVRRVFDIALAEFWNDVPASHSHDSDDQALGQMADSQWHSAMIDSLVNSWGIGFANATGEVTLNWNGLDSSGRSAFKLNVGDYQWDFVIDQGVPTLVSDGQNIFHNEGTPADINGDQVVNAIDALVAINHLNRNGGSMMLPSGGDGLWMKNDLDVNGDRWISAMDALMVINHLKRRDYSLGETEDGDAIWGGDIRDGGDGWLEGVIPDYPTLGPDLIDIVIDLNPGGDDSRSGDESSGSDPVIDDPNGDYDGGSGDGTWVWDGGDWSDHDGRDGAWEFPGFGAAKDDYVNLTIAIGDSLPSVVIDVLANDDVGMTIVEFGEAMAGEVEWVSSDEAGASKQLRYVPGATFNGYDSFLYTGVDADGKLSTARVFISYAQESVSFAVNAPEVIDVAAGVPTKLVDSDGNPLISIDYDGALNVKAGLWITWKAPERPYNGDTFSGRFVSEGYGSENGFYDDARGGAWIYGSIDEVNLILRGLIYEPAPGFSAVDGAGLTVYAYLYETLQVGYISKDLLIRVPRIDNAPIAKEDDFVISDLQTSYVFDVLANDIGGKDSDDLELVDVQVSAFSWYSEVEIDAATGKVVYRPSDYFNGLDVFSYTVRDKNGLLSQGIVRVWAEGSHIS